MHTKTGNCVLWECFSTWSQWPSVCHAVLTRQFCIIVSIRGYNCSVMEPSLLHKRGCVQRTQFSRVGPGHQPTVPLLCNWLPRPHSQAVESRVHISFENLCWTSTGCGLCQISSKLYVSRYRLIGPHLSLMGPTVWKLCQTLHRTQEFSLCFDDFSGRPIPSLRWGRPAHSSVGLNRRQYD